ncbi:PTS sugar transporter subunit IIA [Pelobacter seleniigenes]|uniref:PTS sugar transporter subunit IIA n=1 Tax=Pelobacter seleniigenes TaxID=407188 RepID=UPI0005633C77|nr:PTS sugar transporter subunit IIA [Pelobacter seleniigenes]
MIGIVVISHAGLAAELVQAAELILGPLDKVKAISINRSMSVDNAKAELQQAIDQVGIDGQGVMILSDLFGGTPTNISAEFLAPGAIEILTGVNLPMLIKCAGARNELVLEDLAGRLKEYARDAIIRPMELLRNIDRT